MSIEDNSPPSPGVIVNRAGQELGPELVDLLFEKTERSRLEAAIGRLLLAHNQLEQALVGIITAVTGNGDEPVVHALLGPTNFQAKVSVLRAVLKPAIDPEFHRTIDGMFDDIGRVTRIRNMAAHGWAPEYSDEAPKGTALMSKRFRGPTKSLTLQEIEQAGELAVTLSWQLPHLLVAADYF